MSSPPTPSDGEPPSGQPTAVIDSSDRIPHQAVSTPVHPDCTALPTGSIPSHPTHTTLPPTTITDLQRALASADPNCLTHLISSLQASHSTGQLTPLPGPDGSPLFLETVALFCWGAYQNNFMIEDCLTTLLRLHNMNPSFLTSQAVLQPLLETASIPPSWLRPNSRLYTNRGCSSPLAVPMVGLLHIHNHFITVYVSSSYWTISDPLTTSPHALYNTHLWESNLHNALRRIHSALGLPAPDLPKYLPLPAPLSLQQDSPKAPWSCGTHAMLAILHILLGLPPHDFPHSLPQTHINSFHNTLLHWVLHGQVPSLQHLPSILPLTRPPPLSPQLRDTCLPCTTAINSVESLHLPVLHTLSLKQ